MLASQNFLSRKKEGEPRELEPFPDPITSIPEEDEVVPEEIAKELELEKLMRNQKLSAGSGQSESQETSAPVSDIFTRKEWIHRVS